MSSKRANLISRRGRRLHERILSSCAVVVATLGVGGCFTGADTRQPDPKALYFPTGLTVSPGGTTLYVANSDFDLRFAGGSVMALDLGAIREAAQVIANELASGAEAAEACAKAGKPANPDLWLNPGPCAAFPVAPFIRRSVNVGAFASGLLLSHEAGGDRARLFVPVRGEPSITYFDVDDDRNAKSAADTRFRLDCQVDDKGFCGTAHRLGRDPDRTLRGIQLPADPVGMASIADGTAIVTAHQTQGAASLLINDWNRAPTLSYFISDLAEGPTELASLPVPAFVEAGRARAKKEGRTFSHQPGFALTFRGSSQVDLLRFMNDTGAVPPRPFLTRGGSVPLTSNASAFDSRGIAIVDSALRRCEASCQTVADELACLVGCAETHPPQVFLANRAPASVLLGRVLTNVSRALVGGKEVVTGATETLSFFDSLPLSFGPSRVEVGSIVGKAGTLEPRVFVVAFDSRSVFMINPATERVDAVIRTGRGPHDIAFDVGVDENGQAHAYLLVGHFTDSYIGVVDLDSRRPQSYGQMFASIGEPLPPQESK